MANSLSQKPCVQGQAQSPEACGSTDMMSLGSFWDPQCCAQAQKKGFHQFEHTDNKGNYSPLYQVGQNQVTKVNFCFGFPADYEKLKETLMENKQNPLFHVFITQTQLLVKNIHTHSNSSFPHMKQQIMSFLHY